MRAFADRIVRSDWRDKVGGYEPSSLMNKLVEGVLAVCARLAPNNGSRVVGDAMAISAGARTSTRRRSQPPHLVINLPLLSLKRANPPLVNIRARRRSHMSPCWK